MLSFSEWVNFDIDQKVAKRKYGNSPFPELTANNKRNIALERLKRRKFEKLRKGSSDGGDSSLGSPTGTYNY